MVCDRSRQIYFACYIYHLVSILRADLGQNKSEVILTRMGTKILEQEHLNDAEQGTLW
jgi:hypothetical protein